MWRKAVTTSLKMLLPFFSCGTSDPPTQVPGELLGELDPTTRRPKLLLRTAQDVVELPQEEAGRGVCQVEELSLTSEGPRELGRHPPVVPSGPSHDVLGEGRDAR